MTKQLMNVKEKKPTCNKIGVSQGEKKKYRHKMNMYSYNHGCI